MQVLSNLIGNAVKFTPAGGVISLRSERSGGREVLFTVADTGAGIPDENPGQIFHPHRHAKRTAPFGAGPGVPLAKGIGGSPLGEVFGESGAELRTPVSFPLPTRPAG